MADAPYVTGNDILAYRGDPGLAAGAANGIMPTQGDPYAGISTAIDRINETHAQKAILDYKQKIDQQDALKKMLAETGGSVFNMKGPNGQNMSYQPLADDEPILNAKAKELHDLAIDHPSNYQFNKDWVQKYMEYNQFVNHAGARAVAYQGYNNDMLKATDPQEQANIKAWRDQEIKGHKLDEGYNPEPYLAKLPANEEDYFPSSQLKDDNNYNTSTVDGVDAQGNQVQTTSKTLKPNVSDFRSSLIPGTKAYQSAARHTQDYMSTIATNPAYVAQQNKNIDDINIANKYVDANGNVLSQHVIPHIADVVTLPDGTQTVKINTADPRNVAYALKAEQIGLPQITSKITKDKAQLDKEELENQNTAAETAYKKGQLEHLGDDKKLSPEEIKENLNKKYVATLADDVHKVYNDATAGKKPINIKLDIPTVSGLNVKDYNVYPPIPAGKADKYIGLPGGENTSTTVDKKTGDKTVQKSKDVSLVPDLAYPIVNKKTGDKQIVYMKDGSVVSVVPEKQAIVNGIKHEANYVPAQYENKVPFVDDVYNNKRNAGSTTPASPVVATRPSSVPATAILKNGFYVDKVNKKIFNLAGEEIQRQ